MEVVEDDVENEEVTDMLNTKRQKRRESYKSKTPRVIFFKNEESGKADEEDVYEVTNMQIIDHDEMLQQNDKSYSNPINKDEINSLNVDKKKEDSKQSCNSIGSSVSNNTGRSMHGDDFFETYTKDYSNLSFSKSMHSNNIPLLIERAILFFNDKKRSVKLISASSLRALLVSAVVLANSSSSSSNSTRK